MADVDRVAATVILRGENGGQWKASLSLDILKLMVGKNRRSSFRKTGCVF